MRFCSSTRICVSVAVLSVAVLLIAGAVEARTFRLSGNWAQRVGGGGAPGNVGLNLPIFGGIQAKAGTIASATGSSPATATIPTNAFTDAVATANLPIPGTTLVQISTMFGHFGPSAAGVMRAGAKGTRPANFGFCPGAAANPGCTSPQTGGTQGTVGGLVSYTAGPNQFGGTMRMLASGTGAVSILIGTAPIRIQHNPVGNPTGIPVGAVYAATFITAFPGGPITTGAVCAGGPCGPNGAITVPGVPDGTGTATTNGQTDFPWTTGIVMVQVVDGTPGNPIATETATITGSDARTNLGAGELTLVAGGLLQRISITDTAIATGQITMEFKPKNLPTMTPSGFVALGALLVLGVGYAYRKRIA